MSIELEATEAATEFLSGKNPQKFGGFKNPKDRKEAAKFAAKGKGLRYRNAFLSSIKYQLNEF